MYRNTLIKKIDKQIDKVDNEIKNIDNEICDSSLYNILRLLNVLEQKTTRLNYNCKKCLIIAKNKDSILTCYNLLINETAKLPYDKLISNLNTIKSCKLHKLDDFCFLNALNVKNIHNCIHKNIKLNNKN